MGRLLKCPFCKGEKVFPAGFPHSSEYLWCSSCARVFNRFTGKLPGDEVKFQPRPPLTDEELREVKRTIEEA